jgi:hypothetical protein
MQGVHDGFVKLFFRPGTGMVGGVVVAQRASKLIHPIAVAVGSKADCRRSCAGVHGLSVDVVIGGRGGSAPAATVVGDDVWGDYTKKNVSPSTA